MSHLSPDELRQWFERGQAVDRERVITHLAECDTCRKSLSAMATATEIESRPALTVADAVPMGYAARKPAPAATGWSAWLRPAYGLAGAALIVLAVFALMPGRQPEDDAIRSSELLAIAPVGTSSALEFRWESPFDVPGYRVTVRDARGDVVWWREKAAAPLAGDEQLRARLVAGESYSWHVTALDRGGEVVADSKPVSFRYQP